MKVYTTGQVARICKVAPRTVNRWFDSGRLRGYRIPGSQDRRIPREYLINFLKEHGTSLGDLRDEVLAKVLIVTDEQEMFGNLLQEMGQFPSFRVAVATNGIEAGIIAGGNFHPDCVVVDFLMGRDKAREICQTFERINQTANVVRIALLPECASRNPDDLCINESFGVPFDAKVLAARLLTLIGVKKELL